MTEKNQVNNEFEEQIGNAEYFYTSDFKLACFLRSKGAKFKGVKNFGSLEYPHFRFEFEQGVIGSSDVLDSKNKFKELREMWNLGNESEQNSHPDTMYCVAVLNANKELKMCLNVNFEKRKKELEEKFGKDEAEKYFKINIKTKQYGE